jgi:hypothetical protein
MPEPLNDQDFAGPHPTCREFVTQLTAWGFTQRRNDHVHTVFRGPRGGTLRVIRSQLGRVDPGLVGKAARLAGTTPAQFWAGPQHHAMPVPPKDTGRAGGTSSRRKRTAHDSGISLVLAIHAEADRPLGFDQVVELSGNRVTRAQVSTASSSLCRDGQLDRIRSGVYSGHQASAPLSGRSPPAAALPKRSPTPSMRSCPRSRPRPQAASPEICPSPSCSASSSRTASR